MQNEFLNLGKHPIANGFLTKEQLNSQEEFFFNMRVGFDDETCLVSLMEFVDPKLMFNDTYMYHSSGSQTMIDHFSQVAKQVKENKFRRVLEIGSNDGVFLKHFDPSEAISVEPCSNFAEMTREMGYETYNCFWDMEASENIKSNNFVDVIYSANCMCHIPEIQHAFDAIKNVLDPNTGVFIFEDPCIVDMLMRNSYDQIYDEHAHLFSLTSLHNLLENSGMEIFDVQRITTHGGSNRIFAKPKDNKMMKIEDRVYASLREESSMGIDNLETYMKFSKSVEKSKEDLLNILHIIKQHNKKIVSYGATSKSTCVFNYCGIGPDIIDYIIDNTKTKQDKLSPGVHIPVVDPSHFDETVDYAFLGAWNFFDEIYQKESDFVNRGGKFITHIPTPRIIRQKNNRYYKGTYKSIDQVQDVPKIDFIKKDKNDSVDMVVDAEYFKAKYNGLVTCIEEGKYKNFSLIVDNEEEVSSLLDILYKDIDYKFGLNNSDVVYFKSNIQYEKDPSKKLAEIIKSSPKTIILEDITCTDHKTCASLESIDHVDFKPFWFISCHDLDSYLEGYEMVSRIPYDIMIDMNNHTLQATTETIRYDDQPISH